MNPCVKTERICDESGNNEFKTRKGTGFKSLRLEYWEINQAAPKCQINYWTKLAKKGLKQKKSTSIQNFAYSNQSTVECLI